MLLAKPTIVKTQHLRKLQCFITGKHSNQLTYCGETKKRAPIPNTVRAKETPPVELTTVGPAIDKHQALAH